MPAGARPLEVVELLEFVVAIDHGQRDRAAKRPAPPDSGQNLHTVRLDPLPPSPAVSTLSPTQFVVDDVGIDLHPRRKPVHEGNQSLAMRFTSSPVS